MKTARQCHCGHQFHEYDVNGQKVYYCWWCDGHASACKARGQPSRKRCKCATR